MRGWRAYYADGRRIDSSQAAWTDLPDKGLVGVVVFEEPPYRTIIDGGDWIWLEDGEIRKSDTIWGGWVDPPDVACSSCVKRGEAMDDGQFRDLQAEMMRDKEWP